MNVVRWMATVAVMACAAVAMPRTAGADEWNKETTLTFDHAVAIPGKVLPAGTYVFRLADSPTDRHLVQVFDHTGKILASVITIPADTVTAADDTRILFDERAAGAPLPIKKWFYPGRRSGEEFVYSLRTN